MSGAQIVFGIARRVLLSEYSKVVFGRKERVWLCKTSSTRNRREYNITRVQSADNFCSVTPRHHPVIISNHFLACRSMFRDAVLLARLVEAEIVSPYCGILINTGVGNPTIPLA